MIKLILKLLASTGLMPIILSKNMTLEILSALDRKGYITIIHKDIYYLNKRKEIINEIYRQTKRDGFLIKNLEIE